MYICTLYFQIILHGQISVTFANHDTYAVTPENQNFVLLDGYTQTSVYAVIQGVKSRIRCSLSCLKQTTPKCISFSYIGEYQRCELSLYTAEAEILEPTTSQVYQIEGTVLFSGISKVLLQIIFHDITIQQCAVHCTTHRSSAESSAVLSLSPEQSPHGHPKQHETNHVY